MSVQPFPFAASTAEAKPLPFNLSSLTPKLKLPWDLRLPGSPAPVPTISTKHESNYFIHGWRWHHISLQYELGRFRQMLDTTNSCSDQQVADIVHSIEFLRTHLGTHDRMESKLFVPWLKDKVINRVFTGTNVNVGGTSIMTFLSGTGQHSLKTKSRDSYLSELKRVEHGQVQIQKLLDSIYCVADQRRHQEQRQVSCPMFLRSLRDSTSDLLQVMATHYARSESSIIPLVAETTTEKEQREYNSKVLHYLSWAEKSTSLVTFNEAMNKSKLATSWMKSAFDKEVPKPVWLLMPMWRKAVYAAFPACE